MRLYDSHCHVDALDHIAGALERAQAAGVAKILVPGVEPAQWARARALASPQLRFAVGLHPCVDASASAAELRQAAEDLDAVAIGEFGWHRSRIEGARDRQDRHAELHLHLARATARPLILHVVGWHTHALDWLRARCPHGARGAVHAYSGSPEQVREYCALGLSLSFGPSLLRDGARRPREAARWTPPERLLVETDAPDQRPPGKRRGEPADLREVLNALAEARGESPEHVARLTFENAARLFG